MKSTPIELQAAARAEAFSLPLEQVDPSNPEYFANDTVGHYFERLRRDAPVHKTHSPYFGDFWSVTRFQDIMAVDTNHAVYSSDWQQGGISIRDLPTEDKLQMFIAMDPPKHDEQRKAVSNIVAPGNLANMESLIRERTCHVLDSLPRNETFNWVDRVSVELTTLMLATLFDFPLEDRKLLTHWSDVATANKDMDPNAPSPEERRADRAAHRAERPHRRVAAHGPRHAGGHHHLPRRWSGRTAPGRGRRGGARRAQREEKEGRGFFLGPLPLPLLLVFLF